MERLKTNKQALADLSCDALQNNKGMIIDFRA